MLMKMGLIVRGDETGEMCEGCESFWARVGTGHIARGASLFGHEMMPDSSSGAGARGVSAWAPWCEVMKQILDQSLGGAILFEHATNTLLPLSPLLLLPLPLFQRFKELL